VRGEQQPPKRAVPNPIKIFHFFPARPELEKSDLLNRRWRHLLGLTSDSGWLLIKMEMQGSGGGSAVVRRPVIPRPSCHVMGCLLGTEIVIRNLW